MAFKEFIAEFLNGLRDSAGRRINYVDLAKAAELSRTTLYNWAAGTPATDEKIAKLAAGMKKLVDQHQMQPDADPLYNDPRALAKRLKDVLVEDSDSPATYFYFEHLPVCSLPTSAPKVGVVAGREWSFLESIMTSYLKVTECEAAGRPCDVSDFESYGGNDVLVGLFPMPDRMGEWDFVRTPIQLPLNAVVLWSDLAAFVDRVLPLRHRNTAKSGSPEAYEAYLAGLRSVLWEPFKRGDGPRPVLARDVRPVTAYREAGWTYLRSIHAFGDDLQSSWTRKGDRDRYEAEAFREQLFVESERFHNELASAQPRLSELRLPVLVADELTCLSVMNMIGTHPTEPVLLSQPKDDMADPDRVVRPRYAPSLAVRRDFTREPPAPSPLFERLQASFAEFIWSYSDLVAQEYVRLYRSLLERFGGDDGPVGGVAPVYFLRWLSLHIQKEEIEQGKVVRPEAAALETLVDLRAWRDVLRNVRRQILDDPELLEGARSALGPPTKEKQDG
ncbi:MAG TPA: hypothetical protein VFP12_00580 [Allosphingosinicella sp.]|nr:hypothetical protein [Allosphingosinicella sp.]